MEEDSIWKNSVDPDLLNRVAQDFFQEPTLVRIDMDIEGYKLREKAFVLGCRAGPSTEIDNLFHEMGHLAEREIPKLIRRPSIGWGYHFGQFWQAAGRSGYEPTNDKPVQREIRVWAYQLSLARHYNAGTTAAQMTRSARYLDSFWFYIKHVLPEYKQYDYEEMHRKALEILAKNVEKLAEEEYTFLKFREAWNTRMQALQASLKTT